MQRAGVDATAADAGVVAAPARRSGDWRSDAHAFYEALGFERSALAFRRRLPDG